MIVHIEEIKSDKRARRLIVSPVERGSSYILQVHLLVWLARDISPYLELIRPVVSSSVVVCQLKLNLTVLNYTPRKKKSPTPYTRAHCERQQY